MSGFADTIKPEIREDVIMRTFLVACLAAVLIAAGAAVVLNSSYVPDSASQVFSTQGVRI